MSRKQENWHSFQEVVAEVHADDRTGLKPLVMILGLSGPRACPSPPWDPHGTYRVALVGDVPQIQRLDESNAWVLAGLQGPRGAESASTSDEVVTKSTNILFMDVAGWSKLGADEIHAYVTTAMPRLAKEIVGHDFLNTWGDAIVATFPSAKQAAESALKVRDFFERALPRDGIPEGLTCRIALHQGEVLVCANSLLGRKDIFGDAVAVAARLEPATPAGQVYCTDAFARALGSVSKLAPRTWPVGNIALPKGFGSFDVHVVTWANKPQPAFASEPDPAPADTAPALGDDDAEALLLGWVNQLPVARSGESFRLHELDRDLNLVPGSASRLLEGVVRGRGGGWRVQTKTGNVIVLQLERPSPVVTSDRMRGW